MNLMEEIRLWVLPGLGLVSLIWQIATALRKNAVRREDIAALCTTNDLVAVNKLLQDQIDEESKRVTEASHRIDLLKKDLHSLPDHSTVDDLRGDIVALKEAASSLNAEMRMLRGTVERMDEFLRNHRS